MPVTLENMPKLVMRFVGVEGANRIEEATRRGVYGTSKKALAMAPTAIVDEVKKSNLRGRGGAGFPTGMKWGFIPKDAKTTYLVINADESEPGTCKDRELLYWDPHTLIEGIIISSYALGCSHAYIYIRGEMIREARVLQKAVDEAYAAGHLNKPGVYELPMGIPLREVIDKVCGGVPGGKKVKAVIPGGSSMPPLDGSELDIPMEFDALMTDERIKPVQVRPGVNFDMGAGKILRTMAGSGGVIVMDEDTDLVAVTARIMRFYAHESCGQCTPCREGTGWLARICTRLSR